MPAQALQPQPQPKPQPKAPVPASTSISACAMDHNVNDGIERMVQNPMAKLEVERLFPQEEKEKDSDHIDRSILSKMWTKEYIGLYSQYAAVGLMNGSLGMTQNLCVYYYSGASNLCANANNIIQLAWSFKIVYAVLTDSYRPFGMRRKPYMIVGWALVLVMLFVLALVADQVTDSTWVILLMACHCFLMISDVPADGYCVELGQMESPEERGQILATGQSVRFSFCVLAGIFQSFLMNGPTTNAEDCPIGFDQCWSWGLTVNQYYALTFCCIFVLFIPILYLKEPDGSRIPRHTVKSFVDKIFDTMQNLTTQYVVIYVVGIHALTGFTSNAAIMMQYYVIGLTNFQSGIDTITSYLALVAGVMVFKTYLINKSWRFTSYLSVIVTSVLGLMWLLAYYNTGGLRNGWFTIFVDMDKSFTHGLSQVLYSMAVIELSQPGLEATTYELMTSLGNAAMTVSGILATQLLWTVNANGCEEDCGDDEVNISSGDAFDDSKGPSRFTHYELLLMGIALAANFTFTQFLPRQKEHCEEWKKKGEAMGKSRTRAYIFIVIVVIVVSYGIMASVLLLDADTSCLKLFGGAGC